MSILRVEKLESCYEKSTVFRDLDFEVKEGEVTTIIGPNGCGKSTLLKTIGRILKQKSGKIFFRDQDLSTIRTRKIAQHIALLPQNPIAPPELKVEELVSYGRYPHRKNLNKMSAKDKEIIEWALDVTNIAPYRNREIGSLSGGQRQKVWLAMAFAQDTEILLLDEPTTYLDMAHQLEVLQIVEKMNMEQKQTVVMVLHDINHAARFSHRIVAMKQGEIIASGHPHEIITKDVLNQVFHIDARIMLDPENGAPVCYGYDSYLRNKSSVAVSRDVTGQAGGR
ncbi:ABC transporter ATP-binding protein [Paenibacillus lutrae]|uniref:ATP-binding cassette domain-containing protein n=1 Tax=Paenibacillus lutrae TaxID=2078573 RepID=A0A7X3FEU9_9BACL|nr:ABC transporter ATP-binding protein [Paenibacillus lutrae]MVO98395.1 ATP-binding cassette domain-containing protein [Paenibacillus lutrae]